jgi:D-methionine transport system substrate-binding protein
VLENNGLVKIKPDVGEFPTIKDIAENPKNLQIKEVEGAQVVRAIDDVDFIVSEEQSIALSRLNPTPLGKVTTVADKYAIVLATWQGKENEPKIQKLNTLLKRPEVRDFIDKHFEGRIVPVF